MNENIKTETVYKTIGEVTKDLGLIDKKKGTLQTHTIRYWEKQFKEIRPTIRAGKRRYYSKKDLEVIKKIKFLLKEKGLTISGVKKILERKKKISIDASSDVGLYRPNLRTSKSIKDRVKRISKILKEIKEFK